MAKQLLMGNEAMAYAALEAGVRVAAGYPGTPSSEIIETIGRLHASGAAQGVHVEWSTNEKAALELLGGASIAGARCLFTCKQMGLNVASDPLMCLNYVGVRGGLVLIVADDPGPISSQTEQDTRRFAAFAKVPVLDPATPEQAYEMVKAAFDLSETIQAPVIVRPTTRVDHASAFFDVPDKTEAREVPDGGFERDPAKWVIFPRRSYAAHADINARLPQVANMFSEEYPWVAFNPVEEFGSAQIVAPVPAGQGGAHRHAAPRTLALGIVAGGVSAAYAREAMRIVADSADMAGVELPACRFMQIGTPYPFPEQAFARFAEGLTDILVIEELDYVLEDELLRFAGRTHAAYAVHGKLTGEALDRGENDVDDIAARIATFLDAKAIRSEAAEQDEALGIEDGVYGAKDDAYEAEDDAYEIEEVLIYEGDLPVRPPVLCPGCPHRGSFYAVKQALGSTPAVLCGDIGCYTLGNAKPLDAVDTCLCMGAGVTMAQGLAVADPGKKAVAFIGDSTFFASGMPGLANAAYNGHDITVVVLDNATTAMTGGQPHPGTGITLMGENRKPLSIAAVLNANGFPRVFRANPLDKDAAIVAAKAALAYKGPSAIIFSSPCVQLREPDSPVYVDRAACIGCRRCITEIGCPAISYDPLVHGPKSGSRGQAVVDPSQCNGCGLCTQVCTLQAIVTAEGAKSAAGVVAAGTAEAAIAAQRVSAVRPSATGMIDKVVSWREACRVGEAEEAEKVDKADEAETIEEADEAEKVEEIGGAAESPEETIGDEAEEIAAEAAADEAEEGFADDGAEMAEDDAFEAAVDDAIDEDDFEIIVVGAPKESEPDDDAKRAIDEDDFEIIVVGAPEEPESEVKAGQEDADESGIEESATDGEADEPFEIIEVGRSDEAEEQGALEELEEAEEGDESDGIEEAEETDEPDESEEIEEAEESEGTEEAEEAEEPEEPEEFEEPEELEEPIADESGYSSIDEFIYEEDGQIYEPVENGYSGSEVFLDIPFDDDSFAQKDWYSWKRGGSHD